MQGGMFLHLTQAEHRQVLEKVTSQGFSPDPDGVRAFLLAKDVPPRPNGRDPLLHLALHTLGPFIRKNMHQA